MNMCRNRGAVPSWGTAATRETKTGKNLRRDEQFACPQAQLPLIGDAAGRRAGDTRTLASVTGFNFSPARKRLLDRFHQITTRDCHLAGFA